MMTAAIVVAIGGCAGAQELPLAWSVPRPVTDSVGQPVHLTTPVAIARDGGFTVAGRSGDAAWLHHDARPVATVGLPALSPTLARRRALLVWVATAPAGGGISLIWAEQGSDGVDSSATAGQSLWTATVNRHGQWGIPHLLYRAHQLFLSDAQVAPPVVGPDGVTHFAVGAVGTDGAPVALHLALRADGWTVTAALARLAGYTAIGVDARGTLVMAVMTPGGPETAVRNAVAVIRSSDGGRSWSAPQFLSHDGVTTEAREPRVVGMGGGFLVVWGLAPDGRFFPDTLVRARSTDDGLSWSRLTPVALGDNSYGFRVAVDRCERVEAAWRHGMADGHVDVVDLSAPTPVISHLGAADNATSVSILTTHATWKLYWARLDVPSHVESLFAMTAPVAGCAARHASSALAPP